MAERERQGFKEIPGFSGYWINRHGEVRSQRGRGDTWRKLTFHIHKYNGRAMVGLRQNGKTRLMKRAVLLLTTFVGPRPPGMECCHENDVVTDDDLSNLRWDTHANNIRDRGRNGHTSSGKRNGRAKITDDDVREIRRLKETGLTLREIAGRYPISKSMISYICRGEFWVHVE
jgi:hypothetical protein